MGVKLPDCDGVAVFEGVVPGVNVFERLAPGVGVRVSVPDKVPVGVTELPPERVRVAVAVGLPTADRVRVPVAESVGVPETRRVRVVVVVGLRDAPRRVLVVVDVAVGVAGTTARVREPEAVSVPPALDRVAVTVGLVALPRERLRVAVGDTTALDRVAVTVGVMTPPRVGVRAEVPIGIWELPIANRDTNSVSNLICYSKGNNK